MALLDVRKQFVKLSGRYDLVTNTTSWADNGADWFINSAQKYLDRCLDNVKIAARYYVTLDEGQSSCYIPTARALKSVWVNTSTERTRLTEATLETLRSEYDGTQVGVPTEYAPLVARLLGTSDLSFVNGMFADGSYSNDEYTALFFGKNAEEAYAIEVHGLFYSPKLTADDSQSYWTETHDDILVQATLMRLESFYRNFEGVRDSKAMVDYLVAQLDMDAVAQEIANIAQIGG